MKIIKYNLCTRVNHGTEESPEYEDILSVEMGSREESGPIVQPTAAGMCWFGWRQSRCADIK